MGLPIYLYYLLVSYTENATASRNITIKLISYFVLGFHKVEFSFLFTSNLDFWSKVFTQAKNL